jgi:hypothetical protein
MTWQALSARPFTKFRELSNGHIIDGRPEEAQAGLGAVTGTGDAAAAAAQGRAVQVDPVKPALKCAGTKRMNLKYYNLLSSSFQI